MARIICDVEEIELPSAYRDRDVPSILATCRKCGHETESYGTGSRSIKRCLVLMREECPRRESHFYITEDQDEA